MTPTASVLIRTKNEARHLAETLEGVLKQSVPPLEVLVIDSGSTDATLEVAARYPVTILRIPPEDWSYPGSLNLGARRASGEILVCLSAHCPPVDDEWLANLLRHFDDPAVAAAWGPGLRPGRPVPVPDRPIYQRPGCYTVANRTWGLSNANSALRRSLWETFPFDERLPAAEDKAWGREAMARGYSIVYEPAAAVWHETHAVAAAFRRNRAVMEGFRMIFPELEAPQAGLVRRVLAAAWRVLRYNLRNRDLRTLGLDLRRAPSTLAALIGGYVRHLRRR